MRFLILPSALMLLLLNSCALNGGGLAKRANMIREVEARPLGHGAIQVMIDGWDRRWVREQFDSPAEIRRKEFVISACGRPLPEGTDEQWIYRTNMGHRLIAFHRGRVVLAVEERVDH